MTKQSVASIHLIKFSSTHGALQCSAVTQSESLMCFDEWPLTPSSHANANQRVSAISFMAWAASKKLSRGRQPSFRTGLWA